MAHEFESGISIGETSWHGLEDNQQEEIRTIREALVEAGMTWIVGTEPMYRLLSDGAPEVVPTGKFTVRLSDNSILGHVGPDYKVVQIYEGFAPLQSLIDCGYMDISTCMSLRKGQKVLMCFKIKGEAQEVLPGDAVEGYFLACQGFDGKTSLFYIHTPIRVVCMNTLGMAINLRGELTDGYTRKGISFSHTANVDKRIEALKENFQTLASEFTKTIEAYRQTTRTQVNPTKFFEALLGIDLRREEAKAKGEEESRKNTRLLTKLMECYETQPGANFGAGSGWQAYNAVTYFTDHVRGRDENRLDNALFNSSAALKQKALVLALAA